MAGETQTLIDRLEELKAAALSQVNAAAGSSELETLRIQFLGKKSELSQAMRQLKDVLPEDRPKIGQVANVVRDAVESAIAEQLLRFTSTERTARLAIENLDVTLPGRPAPVGKLHPLTRTLYEIEDIFTSMGFEVATGPDMETDFYNFESLNFPPDHPARDMQDTFFLDGGGVLRTHTSPVQIRTMKTHQPPIAVIAPGRVYRCDADVTHSPMFHQVEGFLVDKDIRFSDLKGILGEFLLRMMGPETEYRFRPSFFPFTEPSAEVDIMWKIEGREPAWLEVLGSGMIHPNVLRAGGYDPNQVRGFAFGMGVERFAMLKYGISNINLFFENDLRFLGQF